MKSPILILLIICNLLVVNLVSASSMFDHETTESHLIQLQDDTILTSGIDETSCDHTCHLFAHMIGFISQTTSLAVPNTSNIFTIQDDLFLSRPLDPPIQPPQA